MKAFSCISAGLGLALAACSTTLPPSPPPTFARPQRVAFACFDTVGKKVLPLKSCRPVVADAGTDTGPTDLPDAASPTDMPDAASSTDMPDAASPTDMPDAATPQATSDAAVPAGVLHALVTQSDRGEVAAVDLGAMLVIDSRQDIPGFTFVPAGELPGPIVVPPEHAELTYVANRGSRDISVLYTAAFRELMVGQDATKQRVRLEVDPAQGAVAPFDMLLAPEEDALFVSAADAGLLLRVPIQRCQNLADDAAASCNEGELDMEHAVVVPLEASLPQAQPVAPPPDDDEEPYKLICHPELLQSVPMATKQVSAAGAAGTPQPAGLALDAFCRKGADACKRRLLVADKRLPIVHVIDLDVLASGDARAAVLPPIVTGVATERVAVTPRVPVDVQDDAGETQYVYAIDASDGSVLVAHDGRVLNVASDPTTRADRLDLGRSSSGRSVALSLAILTPAFDVTGPAGQWVLPDDAQAVDLPKDVAPQFCTDPTNFPDRLVNRLRGVFLAVGLTDGTVRFVDIHDMELRNCRSCQPGGTIPVDDVDECLRTCEPIAGMPQHCATACASATASKLFDPYPKLRNRPRINVSYIPPSGIAAPPEPLLTPQVTPLYEIGSDAIGLNQDGSINDPRVSGLACRACPSSQEISFPAPVAGEVAGTGVLAAGSGAAGSGAGGSGDTAGGAGAGGSDGSGSDSSNVTGACAAGEGRVCSLADPWIDPIEWVATYEGVVPGARGGRGRFIGSTSQDNHSGDLEFSGEPNFCGTGVLGSADVGAAHSGDQLEIVSPAPDDQLLKNARAMLHDAAALQEDAELRDDCNILFRARDDDKQPIAFRIKQAYQDRLVIESELASPPRDLRRSPLDYAFVQKCFLGMLLTFEVHVSKSYAVSSYLGLTPVAPGFMHRVTTDAASGRCTVDEKQPQTRTGRVYDGEPFDNGFVSFQTVKPPTEPDTSLHLVVSGTAVRKLIFDAGLVAAGVLHGVLPVDLVYSDVDQSLYVVDSTLRGLIPVPMSAVPETNTFSYQ